MLCVRKLSWAEDILIEAILFSYVCYFLLFCIYFCQFPISCYEPKCWTRPTIVIARSEGRRRSLHSGLQWARRRCLPATRPHPQFAASRGHSQSLAGGNLSCGESLVHGNHCQVLPSFYHAQLDQEVSSLDHMPVGLCCKGTPLHDLLGNNCINRVKKWPELRTRTLLSVALIS